jgi:glycosyltransferase involved in cell wall biosynthesis
VLHGHVSERELLDRYRDAGVFVCLSEHEGFGVPLLEAMAAALPVVARDEAAVSETLGGAGVLLLDRSPATAAAAVRVVDDDDELRQRIIVQQDQRLGQIEAFDVEAFLERVVRRAAGNLTGTTVQVQGPFETSYSLAILNRELALTLADHADLEVSLFATEGPGDYAPSPTDLARYPVAADLYARGQRLRDPEVAIRQMYPPRVDDSTAGLTFQYFGWEESRLPQNIVDDFNRHLDGIGTMSTYVMDILAESGVTVPMHVVGVGVHSPDPDAKCSVPELTSLRGTRLLHISSAFPRKGVDVLLRGFFETFDLEDDVTLVLKTFPNPHNNVTALLADLQLEFPAGPHVCWINRDLDRRDLDGLYNLASAYVHTARGEGFGLPVAEAMLASVPVISVASAGLADFVSPDTAAVVGHVMAPADTHLSVHGSMWAEPSVDDLRRELSSLVRGHDEGVRRSRVDAARQHVRTEFNWSRVGDRWHDFIVEQRRHRAGLTVAAVSTFNSRCGIAEYTANLYSSVGDWAQLEVFADDDATPLDSIRELDVVRVWSNHRAQSVDGLLATLDDSSADLVHIQYNFGFYELSELGRLIAHEAPRRPIVVTMHRTAPLPVDGRFESMADIADELRLADAVIVHQDADRDRLAQAGVVDNVHVIGIGTEEYVPSDVGASRRHQRIPPHAFVVGTFGFLLPHKGMIALIRAIGELRSRGIDAVLLATSALHASPSSATYLHEVVSEIRLRGLDDAVRLVTDYLDPDVARERLAAIDVMVLPYEHTNESASAALRFVLPVGRAMVVSDLPIFSDVADIVPSLAAPVDPIALADLLEELWLDDDQRDAIASDVRDRAKATSWQRTAAATRRVYTDVVRTRADALRVGGA